MKNNCKKMLAIGCLFLEALVLHGFGQPEQEKTSQAHRAANSSGLPGFGQPEQGKTLGVRAWRENVSVWIQSETRPAGSSVQATGLIRTGPSGFHRVFVDKDSNFYFGYDLEVTEIPDAEELLVSVGPLDTHFAATLEAKGLKKLPVPLEGVSFPTPERFQNGDTFTLDLLQEPETGATLFDKIRVALIPPDSGEPFDSPPRDFTIYDVELSLINYKTVLDGEIVYQSTGGIKGSILWIATPDGRLVFSLIPYEEYPFEKNGVIEGNRLLLEKNGHRYEWISSHPITPGGGNWNLWVLEDREFATPGWGMVGAADWIDLLWRNFPIPN